MFDQFLNLIIKITHQIACLHFLLGLNVQKVVLIEAYPKEVEWCKPEKEKSKVSN